MKVTPPPARFPSLRELHLRKCFLLGITDPAKVERLWREDEARREAARASAGRG